MYAKASSVSFGWVVLKRTSYISHAALKRVGSLQQVLNMTSFAFTHARS